MQDKKKVDLIFEEIQENNLFNEYTAGCSGSRSDCCTRVCGCNKAAATEEEWGRFLAADGGVVQY